MLLQLILKATLLGTIWSVLVTFSLKAIYERLFSNQKIQDEAVDPMQSGGDTNKDTQIDAPNKSSLP